MQGQNADDDVWPKSYHGKIAYRLPQQALQHGGSRKTRPYDFPVPVDGCLRGRAGKEAGTALRECFGTIPNQDLQWVGAVGA
jgi:hypothetical protein